MAIIIDLLGMTASLPARFFHDFAQDAASSVYPVPAHGGPQGEQRSWTLRRRDWRARPKRAGGSAIPPLQRGAEGVLARAGEDVPGRARERWRRQLRRSLLHDGQCAAAGAAALAAPADR